MKMLGAVVVCIARLACADAARDNRWTQDLDTLSTQLIQRHPNLFFKTSRADFDAAVAALRGAIPDLSDNQVLTGLAGIAALPGDGHTNLYLTQINSTFRMLPLRLQWFQDGLFITGASAAYARALGERVVSIGDRSAEDAHRAAARIISYENDGYARYFSPFYLVNADILAGLGIAADGGPVHFVVQDLTGAQTAMDVAPLAPGVAAPLVSAPDAASGFTPLARQRPDQNYWFAYLASTQTLYFAYNRCSQMSGLAFAAFNDQLWAAFDANPVTNLIVDLRNNPGGDSSVLNPFLTSQAQRRGRFGGVQTTLIVGRQTFSSAVLNAISLTQQFFGKSGFQIVGEPSGGSPNSYGEVQSFTLPNSRLVVNYSTKYFSFPSYPPGSIIPDVSVATYSSDYFARHDPFLASIALGATPPPAPASQVVPVNSASFRLESPLALGSLASAFGDFSAAANGDAAAVPLPKQLGDVQVLVNDVAAPLLAVRSSVINFQVPASTGAGLAAIRVLEHGVEIASGIARIGAAGPAIFGANPFDPARPGRFAMTIPA